MGPSPPVPGEWAGVSGGFGAEPGSLSSAPFGVLAAYACAGGCEAPGPALQAGMLVHASWQWVFFLGGVGGGIGMTMRKTKTR